MLFRRGWGLALALLRASLELTSLERFAALLAGFERFAVLGHAPFGLLELFCLVAALILGALVDGAFLAVWLSSREARSVRSTRPSSETGRSGTRPPSDEPTGSPSEAS